MHYVSTRATSASAARNPENFCDILLGGLAPDGGLYLPAEYPQVTSAELDAWRTLSYADLAFEILRKFATDIPDADLKAITTRTYTPAVYCNARAGESAAEITPLRVLEDGRNGKLILQALSNGPTLAFKDMAMQLLGNLFEYALAKNSDELNIFGATSGDTGSAAEYAMRGKKGVRVFMLSPHGRMSAFQTAQMFSLQDPNIFNIAVKGNFDDCQDLVKAVSNDLTFKARQKIGTVNSINWARVVAQVVYYFRGYLAATTSNDQKVSFTVPSGNFGNICAGHIARMMGLPIDKLVAATNENDVLDEFFRTGVYRVRKAAETFHTSSPSMDISKASNFERFVYDLVGRDAERTHALFRKVDTHGGFDLSGKPGSDGDEFKQVARFGFASGRSTHNDRLDTIRDVADDYDITIDTHTADGIKVAREHMAPRVPMIVLETALAAKFNETILEALGTDAERPAGFDDIEALPQRYVVMPADVAQMKAYIADHTGL
ncbi:threonine synthase [Oxalobacteraceae sp. CFBP 8755]|jgi:threonine synthase|uniref:Threonine synthase n=1 Tax=Massilia aurea TaxID=373040 RepID=A0A7W9WY73_9BURK|nr:threonine synthase [Massilia aurea]MBD8542765.1 threonine synthase [Oxalobacteraceae sp. CFBP 8761]MBD8627361.1 threonine synthase [Oxalobacteraceae sp. CFBP 8753]MBD8631806.1 threonine synthase [Oxalobacteraceae sp. CFBP 8755]MBD8725909.1 threonine synthase [Oxalobacteraceae sp. CFBP 13708]MBB6133029.1 threonine synthase [Massilia aurea]